ncbi:hypothetical protein [Spirosoma utsteinense]|uniref:Uncharacterized protein n=1 Tax=Spirosoma utsteinense TaxID=2585773 RepID=A0ABR6WFI7_9BACT|nr:hypothetical protein [Spirosoma utsteinense]MBC3789415.1 hypothetical protein [Spirosoma utsteinense]MBC3794786.1 hypothetical protein [Spirosoma utsteinense]
MNFASFYERTKELLKSGSYGKISLYLGNETTSQKVKAMLQAELPSKMEDCSVIYKNHEDFNLFLPRI